MAIVRELPLANYPTGKRTIVRQTPNGLDNFRIAIARCTNADPTIWPDPASTISILVECSFDGGLTFPPNGGSIGGTANGGILSKNGQDLPFYVISAGFTPAPNAVRITVEIINGPIRTFADVTAGV